MIDDVFQSTLSVRRATCTSSADLTSGEQFQSTLSVRRATRAARKPPIIPQFQSTLSVRRATMPDRRYGASISISIHALRKESDVFRRSGGQVSQYFNPRSP